MNVQHVPIPKQPWAARIIVTPPEAALELYERLAAMGLATKRQK